MWFFSRKKQQPAVPVLSTSVATPAQPPVVQQPPASRRTSITPAQSVSHSIDVKAECIKSVIAPGEFLEGNLHFQNGVKVDGRIQGNVKFGITDGLFVLNEQGVVEGNIQGPRAIIVGEVFGNIVVEGKLIILPKARIHGDIAAGTLQIMEGSSINGRISTVSEYDRMKTLEHENLQAIAAEERQISQSAPPAPSPIYSPSAVQQPSAREASHADVLRFSVGGAGRS